MSTIQITANGPIAVSVDGVQYVPVGGQPPVNPTPVPPNPTPVPPTTPGTGTDLSDKVEHTLYFQSGVPQGLYCRCSGGYVEISGVAVAGTNATKVRYTVNGGPEQEFSPMSDFRFKCPDSQWMTAGSMIQTTLIIDGIVGDGRFSLQAVGAVGP